MKESLNLISPVENGQEGWISDGYEPGLVSVVVPVFNREEKVIRTLGSVWSQTYRPIELIVVDDGSTDNTFEVLKNWGENHSRDEEFTFIFSPKKFRSSCRAHSWSH